MTYKFENMNGFEYDLRLSKMRGVRIAGSAPTKGGYGRKSRRTNQVGLPLGIRYGFRGPSLGPKLWDLGGFSRKYRYRTFRAVFFVLTVLR